MTLNRPLGLSLVAAALLAVYGCGKEEPKPVAPAAAPAMPEVTVKIGHVGPTTGPQAHLGKDNENGARMAIDDPTMRPKRSRGDTLTLTWSRPSSKRILLLASVRTDPLRRSAL